MPTTLRLCAFSAALTLIRVARKRRRDAEHDAGQRREAEHERQDPPVERRRTPEAAGQQLLAPVADEQSRARRRSTRAAGSP